MRRDSQRVREGPSAVRTDDRHVSGDQAPLRRDAGVSRAGGGCHLGRGAGLGISRPVATRRVDRRARSVDGLSGLRQVQHPGPRRDRLHVGARRPSAPAPGGFPAGALRPGRRAGAPDHRAGRRGRPARRPDRATSRGRAVPVRRARVLGPHRGSRGSGPRSPRSSKRAMRSRIGHDPGVEAPGRSSSSSSTQEMKGVRRPGAPGIGGWITLTLIQHASADQAQRWIRPSMGGEIRWCQLFSEPDAGSDAAGIRTRADRVEGGWVLNGQKIWTSGAQVATHGLATVRTDPQAPKHAGHHRCRRRHVRAAGSRCDPYGRRPATPCSTRCSSPTSSCPTTMWSGRSTPAGRSPRSTLGNERVTIGGQGAGAAVELLDDLSIPPRRAWRRDGRRPAAGRT